MSESHNAVILARVSSKTQEDEGYSLDSQLKLLTTYFEDRGFPIVKVFKIAETASKQKSRKVFHELLHFIEHNKINHLGVEKTDRLTRNMRDALAIDDWLEKDENRRLHAVKENLLLHKGAKSDVKFMWNIHLAVAKKYTDNLREEAMKGWNEKLAQGWLPSIPPPGYMTITANGKRIHVSNPENSHLITRVFSLYLEPNQSLVTITAEMDALGFKTRGGKPYVLSHIHKMLINPFYIGINLFDGKEYPGAQEPLVTREVFDAVQAKMKGKSPIKQTRHNPTLKNVVTCRQCGKMLTWQLQKGRYYGHCQRKTPECKAEKYLREDKVEEAIAEQLKGLVSPSPEIVAWVADKMRNEKRDVIEANKNKLAAINMQVSRIQRMDSTLYDDKLAGEISKEKYDTKHAEFNELLADYKLKKTKIESTALKGMEKRAVLLELSQKAAEIYQNRTPEQKRVIIIELFRNITRNGDSVSVEYTNFCAAVAEKVRKTNKFLEGAK